MLGTKYNDQKATRNVTANVCMKSSRRAVTNDPDFGGLWGTGTDTAVSARRDSSVSKMMNGFITDNWGESVKLLCGLGRGRGLEICILMFQIYMMH